MQQQKLSRLIDQKLDIDPQILEQYQGYIFDMDGTIIDTMGAHSKAWIETGKVFGYDFNPEIMIKYTGASPRDIGIAMMEAVGMPVEQIDELLTVKYKIGLEINSREATLLPAWQIVEDYLGKKKLALGTGSNHKFINLFEQKFNLSKYFGKNIVTAEEVVNHKPHPETFTKCAELLELEPAQCLVFEDGLFGVIAALEGGFDVYNVILRKFYYASKKHEYNLSDPYKSLAEQEAIRRHRDMVV